MKKIDTLLDQQREKEDKIAAFGDLLDDLETTKTRKKALWKEIYENAVSDRERASILFTEAFRTMTGSSSDHASLGSVMAKYLERMCKSNDQILALAEIISKAEREEDKVNPDELFSKISGD